MKKTITYPNGVQNRQGVVVPSNRTRTKVGIYARVSTDDKGQDTDNQVLELKAHAVQQGLTLNEKHVWVEEVSASGGDHKTEFEKMRTAAIKGEFDILLIWSLDRISREGAVHMLTTMNELHSYDIKVKSLKEAWINPEDSTYELMVSVCAWMAQQEAIRMSERTKAGLNRVRLQGKRIGQKPISPEKYFAVLDQNKLGKSAGEISKEVGVSKATVSRILSGKYPPPSPVAPPTHDGSFGNSPVFPVPFPAHDPGSACQDNELE